MGLLFFIAGYFVPGSHQRKGTRRFLRERAYRLGLPVLFYMFILGPVVEYFLAHSWTMTKNLTLRLNPQLDTDLNNLADLTKT